MSPPEDATPARPARPAGTECASRRGLLPVRLLLVVLTFGLPLFGGWLLAVALRDRLEARAVDSWPATTGVVTESSVVDHGPSGSGSGRDPRSRRYEPRVRYEYEVEGQRFEGNRLAIVTPRRGNRAAADRDLDAFRAGTTVTVYYDPEAPATSVLRRGVLVCGTVREVVMGLGFLAGGTLAAWMLFKLRAPGSWNSPETARRSPDTAAR